MLLVICWVIFVETIGSHLNHYAFKAKNKYIKGEDKRNKENKPRKNLNKNRKD